MRHKSYALQVGRRVISFETNGTNGTRLAEIDHRDTKTTTVNFAFQPPRTRRFGCDQTIEFESIVFRVSNMYWRCSPHHIIERDARPHTINHLKRFISSDSMSPFTYSTAGLAKGTLIQCATPCFRPSPWESNNYHNFRHSMKFLLMLASYTLIYKFLPHYKVVFISTKIVCQPEFSTKFSLLPK